MRRAQYGRCALCGRRSTSEPMGSPAAITGNIEGTRSCLPLLSGIWPMAYAWRRRPSMVASRLLQHRPDSNQKVRQASPASTRLPGRQLFPASGAPLPLALRQDGFRKLRLTIIGKVAARPLLWPARCSTLRRGVSPYSMDICSRAGGFMARYTLGPRLGIAKGPHRFAHRRGNLDRLWWLPVGHQPKGSHAI